jgi:thioredoxin-like negative regulator of GroEL
MLGKRFLRGGRERAPAPLRVVLYTRAGCHLCDDMKAVVERVRPTSRVPFTLAEIDVDSDPALAERYGLSIPVLEIAGRAAFKGQLAPDELQRKLARRAAEASRADAPPPADALDGER